MTGPLDNFLRLSTDDFSERERFDAARELFGRAIIKIDFEPLLDVPFRLDMTLRALPDFGLARGKSSPLKCLHRRAWSIAMISFWSSSRRAAA